MNLKQMRRIVRAIHKYTKAKIDVSWAGGGDPRDIPLLNARAKLAKEKLVRALDDATDPIPRKRHD